MTTKEEIQELLRFLSKDAKLPLALAMSKVRSLQSAGLTSAEAISKESITKITPIFGDEKAAKGVLSAAKRVSKKRSASGDGEPTSPKRARPTQASMRPKGSAIEASLELPTSSASEDQLAQTIVHANRAPLVLAFAVKLLEHTHPQQPLSSRLSLAQAVVSANSRSKAVSLGIESGPSAEDQGFGQGQPVVTILGRPIRTLKRWGYDPNEGADGDEETATASADATQSTLKADEADAYGGTQGEIALWALDLEAMREKKPATAQTAELPIFRPESARSYLLKAFNSPPMTEVEGEKAKKKTAAALNAEKEANCALLLDAIDLLFVSWAPYLAPDELDRKAWSWYVAVRPDVASGVAGWGGKNEIRLKNILDLRRKPKLAESEKRIST